MIYRNESVNGSSAYESTMEERQRFRRARVFTTGQIARICHVAPRTVSKWFDSGKLRGYRIPGSDDRRIPRDNLLLFMKAHNFPLDTVGGDDEIIPAIVLAGSSSPWAVAFALNLENLMRPLRAASLFDAALLVVEAKAQAVVFDCSLGATDCTNAARSVRRSAPSIFLIGVLADDADTAPDCYDLTARASDDPALVAAALLERSAV